MKIGLIDVDGHNFPNLPLMKISAWHKQQGDQVQWYQPMFSGHLDRVYMSKVFSFTSDYEYYIDANEVIKGGSGYCIELKDGKEIFHNQYDKWLPPEIEHIYPELTENTAYGFMSRGCPRGCSFCHVKDKEGQKSYKVADLKEFWNGQKNIVLLDPNTIACREWKDILQQLIDSRAWVDFSQGVDIRLMNEEKAKMLKRIRIKNIHFAWDRYEDKEKILPKLQQFKEITNWDKRRMTVYVLTNYDTTVEQDLERIYTLRDMGYWQYVMVYDKEHASDQTKKIQRWVNFRAVFEKTPKYDDYIWK